MGDENRRQPLRRDIEAGDHRRLGLGVERRRGLIHQQDVWLADQGARDGDRLAHPDRQLAPALGQGKVETTRKRRYESIDTGLPRRLQQVGIAGIGIAHQDVVADRTGKQDRVLHHHADIAADIIRPDLTDIGRIDQHRAAIGRVQAAQKTEQRRLAGSDPADNGKPVARLQTETNIRQHRFRLVLICEGDVAELDRALDAGAFDLICPRLLIGGAAKKFIQRPIG